MRHGRLNRVARAPAREELRGTSWPGVDGLDPVLGHRVRLGICVLLASVEGLTFARMKELLDETDGSLGANLKSLEESGYLIVDREFDSRRPVTSYKLSAIGRHTLSLHLKTLGRLIDIAGR